LIIKSFKFTGQFYDSEINQYYLRARQYDPYLGRFTTYDPVRGRFTEPLTLHKYLYCLNDPINYDDPTGKSIWGTVSSILTGNVLYVHAIDFASYAVYNDWRFFDMAGATIQFMPIGMLLAAVSPNPPGAFGWQYLIGGNVAGYLLEDWTHITGMNLREGLLMDPMAFGLYTQFMFIKERVYLGISQAEMEAFINWHNARPLY
jgi:RHS repeat-associated protein